MFKNIQSVNKYRITLILLIICIIALIALISSISKTKNIERSQLDLFNRNLNVYDEISDYIRSVKQDNIMEQVYYLTQIDNEIFNGSSIYLSSDYIRNKDYNKYIFSFISSIQLYLGAIEKQYFEDNYDLLDFDKISDNLFEISLLIKDYLGNTDNFNLIHNTIIENDDRFRDNDIFNIYFRFLDGENVKIEDIKIPLK